MNYNQIFETVDYNEFDWTEINREIVPAQVKKLEQDIDSGFDIQMPILVNPKRVNGKLQVPDGQHRLVALRNKKRPIRYIFATRQMSLNDITRINSTQRPWTTMDYIEAFAKGGNQDYIKLLNFYNEVQDRVANNKNIKGSKVSIRSVSYLTQGNLSNPSMDKSYNIKNGTWKFRLTDSEARKNLNMFLDFQDVTPSCLSEVFIQTIFSMIKHQENFSVKRLLNQAKKYPYKFYVCSRTQDYIRMIEDVYNHNKTQANRVYFRLSK